MRWLSAYVLRAVFYDGFLNGGAGFPQLWVGFY